VLELKRFSKKKYPKFDEVIPDGNDESRGFLLFDITDAEKSLEKFWEKFQYLFFQQFYVADLSFFGNDLKQTIFKIIKNSKKLSGKRVARKVPTVLFPGEPGERKLPDRTLIIKIAQYEILCEMVGRPTKHGKDSGIIEAGFSVEDSPGKVLANGKFDFLELGKMLSVLKGAILLVLSRPIEGKQGLSFRGKVLEPREPLVYPAKFGEGVTEIKNPDGSRRIVAGREGVISFKKGSDGKIVSLDVVDKVPVKNIGLEIGNLGSKENPFAAELVVERKIDPRVKIWTRKPLTASELVDAKIFSQEKVSIGRSYGGEIFSDKPIGVQHVIRSALESLERVKITQATEDSTIKSPELIIGSTERRISAHNLKAEIEKGKVSNTFLIGKNTFVFDENLFIVNRVSLSKLADLRPQIERLVERRKKLIKEIGGKIVGIKKTFDGKLSDTASKLEDIPNNFFWICDHADSLMTAKNASLISDLKVGYRELKEIIAELEVKLEQQKELEEKVAETKEKIQKLSLSIDQALLNTNCELVIICDQKKLTITVESSDQRFFLPELRIFYQGIIKTVPALSRIRGILFKEQRI